MKTTKTLRPRRTFKEVASDAYAKGYAEGRAQGRKDVKKDYDALLVTNLELSNVSLRKLAWSRLTGLFRGQS